MKNSPLLLVLCHLTSSSRGSPSASPLETFSSSQCHHQVQQNIYSSLPACQPRRTLVDLRELFAADHDIIQVVPDHVMVERCGGSCYTPPYTCISNLTSLHTVEVMLVQSKWPHGEHDVRCSEVEVEVHQSCKCGCQLEERHCNSLQYYHQPSCRCVCNNTRERAECIAADKVWDPATCQCHCPLHTVQPCSTGYMFDFSYTCSCLLIAVEGNPGLIAAIALLSFLSVVIVMALVIMHKQKTGLFRESYLSPELGGANSDSKRTVLMSQESKYEYENAIRDTDVTLYQFDQRDKPSKSQDLL